MKTRKDLLDDISSLEFQIKQEISDHAEDLQRSPEVLNSLKFQLDDWKDLVNPMIRGTKLDKKSKIEDAHKIAFNIYSQIQYHWELIGRK